MRIDIKYLQLLLKNVSCEFHLKASINTLQSYKIYDNTNEDG